MKSWLVLGGIFTASGVIALAAIWFVGHGLVDLWQHFT